MTDPKFSFNFSLKELLFEEHLRVDFSKFQRFRNVSLFISPHTLQKKKKKKVNKSTKKICITDKMARKAKEKP